MHMYGFEAIHVRTSYGFLQTTKEVDIYKASQPRGRLQAQYAHVWL